MYLEDWFLHERIKNKKFSAKDFAEKLGVSQSYLSTISNWINRPKYEILLQIEKLTDGAVGAVETLDMFVIKQKGRYLQMKKGKKPKIKEEK